MDDSRSHPDDVPGPAADVRVACYAGYRREQTPRAIVLGGVRRIEVAEVLDQWELTLFERAKPLG